MNKMFDRIYVGGNWSSTASMFSDFNPADGSVWAQIPDCGVQETRAAIDAAHAAFPAWSGLSHVERAKLMLKVADVVEKRRPEVVAAIQGEGGGWFGKGMYEVGAVIDIFHAAAGANYGSVGEVLPSPHGKFSMAVRYPLGVVSVISPWNFPVILTARNIAFTLALGNTVVLKPSEETPYCGGLFFAEIFEEAGVPPGVLNVVTCSRGQGHFLHRFNGRGTIHRGEGRRSSEEVLCRAWREGCPDRLRRCRHGAGHRRGKLRQLHASRSDLHGGGEGSGAGKGF